MSYTTVKLGEICIIYSGGTPSRAKPEYWGGSIPWVKISDMLQGEIIITDERITTEGLQNSSAKIIPKGTLLLSIFATIGRVALLKIDAATNQAIVGIVIKDESVVDKNYLKFILQSKTEELKSQSRGVAQTNINISILKSLEIILPPLAEQQRIASILGKAELIKCKRELAIEKLDELEQGVFYDLVGKVDNFIPLANLIKDKVKHLETKADMVWSLSLEQIESNTGRLLEKVIVPKAILGTSTYFFKPPVILYSKLRPYLNKVITPSEDGYATTELVPLYIKEDILRQSFLTSYLRSKYFVEFANTNSGGAKMPRVMMDKLWQHPVPIPSMDSQIKFEKIFNVIKDKRARLEYGRNITLKLTSSLQSKAFSGQL